MGVKTEMTYSRAISHEELRERLAKLVKGPVLGASDPAYEESRRVFNAMIERRPAAILKCSCAEDIAHAVTLAREYELPISIKGGGHSVAGNAVCEDGLMLDMSSMNRISVDPERGLAVARFIVPRALGVNDLRYPLVPFEREAEAAGGSVEHPHAFRDDLLAYAVARYQSNIESSHFPPACASAIGSHTARCAQDTVVRSRSTRTLSGVIFEITLRQQWLSQRIGRCQRRAAGSQPGAQVTDAQARPC